MKKYRLERIEKEISRVIGKLMYGEIKNPKIAGMISVTRVKLAPDLRNATVFVSVLGIQNENSARVVEGLNEVRGFVRKRVSEEVDIRYLPEIKFKLDDSIEHGIRISKLIDTVVAEKEAENPEEQDENSEEDKEEKE